MAKTNISSVFFLILYVIQCLSIVQVRARVAPALYVFGDSLSDAGNNFFLPGAKTKADYKPYGVDFPNGTFGRFTNGFTFAEHLAFFLGLPIPLPILDPHSQTKNYTDGFNYASSSAGILSDTGVKESGSNLYLGKQVQLFKKTAQEFLVARMGDEKAIKRHLRKSIFLIMIGSDDYNLNYISPVSTKNAQIYNPEQFAELLVLELGRQIQELYDLGARRFVVSEIGPLGCTPAAIKRAHLPTGTFEQVDSIVSFFNTKLAHKTTELNKNLENSVFATMKADFLDQLIKNPTHHGFKDAVNPCCSVRNNEVECELNVQPCLERQSHVFFDAAHTSDAANKLMAEECFKGIGACSPVNIRELLHRHKYVEVREKRIPRRSCKSASLLRAKKLGTKPSHLMKVR